MAVLSETELRCLDTYVAYLASTFGPRLIGVWLFGSAARGELWPPHHPIHSDVDLLVVTEDEPDEALAEELLNATYPLYLECGRQLSTQFLSRARYEHPVTARHRGFLARIAPDCRRLYP